MIFVKYFIVINDCFINLVIKKGITLLPIMSTSVTNVLNFWSTTFYFRDVRRRETAQIQLNVFANLLVAYVLFLFGVKQVQYTILCNGITILMHYTFLVSWFWIAVYSNKLYFSLVKVRRFYLDESIDFLFIFVKIM